MESSTGILDDNVTMIKLMWKISARTRTRGSCQYPHNNQARDISDFVRTKLWQHLEYENEKYTRHEVIRIIKKHTYSDMSWRPVVDDEDYKHAKRLYEDILPRMIGMAIYRYE